MGTFTISRKSVAEKSCSITKTINSNCGANIPNKKVSPLFYTLVLIIIQKLAL